MKNGEEKVQLKKRKCIRSKFCEWAIASFLLQLFFCDLFWSFWLLGPLNTLSLACRVFKEGPQAIEYSTMYSVHSVHKNVKCDNKTFIVFYSFITSRIGCIGEAYTVL